MAASAVKGSPYLQVGPRQGVYCRPSVVLTTWPNGGYRQQLVQQHGANTAGGHVKWRLSQFRSPDHNYKMRARTDIAEDDDIPQIPGKIIERPSSAISSETSTSKAQPPKLQVSHSSCSLLYSTSSNQQARQQHTQQLSGKPARPSSATRLQDRHRKTSTAPVFSIQACAVTIQCRPLIRSFSTPKKIAPPEEPFPYPDPVHIGGDHAFNVRLTELARLQRETVKNEEFRARIARRNAAMNTSSSTTSLQATRQPLRPSSSLTRSSVPGKVGVNRKLSLPVPTVKDSLPSPPPMPQECSVISRKLPVPTKPSSDDSSTNGTADFENNGKAFEHGAVEQTGITMDILPNGSKSKEKHTAKRSPIANTNQSDIEQKDIAAIDSETVVLSEVPPKTHHRELVKAIFSKEQKSRQKHTEDTDTSDASTTCPNNDLESKDRSQTGSTVTTTSSRHCADSNSRTTSHPAPTLPNTHMNNSTSEVSSHSNSSVSSSSITSEHTSPSHDSGKKSQVKPSKKRKHTKKAGRHKHT